MTCETCGHLPHARACRVRMNVGSIHEINCGCNGPEEVQVCRSIDRILPAAMLHAARDPEEMAVEQFREMLRALASTTGVRITLTQL